MTSKICSLASENDTTQLIDKRPNADGTYPKYWIAKLKDGKCWMTQNLDLDIPASGLTAALSDMEVDWNSGSAYKPVATKTTMNGWVSTQDTAGYNTVQSYNPGNYYYTTPSTQNSCTSAEGLAGCTSKGWKLNVTTNTDISGLVDVSDWTATTDPYFIARTSYTGTDGISTCTKKAGALFGDGAYGQCRIYYNTGGDYSKAYEHYHAGNYYSWIAATAGSGNASVTTSGANVDSSICPKGWKLPTSGSGGEFQNAFNGLSVAAITTIPYYFVYGGLVNNSSLSTAGSGGYYWSSTASSDTRAYNLAFTTSVIPSNYSTRYVGNSVRCVAR